MKLFKCLFVISLLLSSCASSSQHWAEQSSRVFSYKFDGAPFKCVAIASSQPWVSPVEPKKETNCWCYIEKLNLEYDKFWVLTFVLSADELCKQ